MVFSMGLHPRIDAPHQHTVVQHPKFPCHRSVPLWNGRHDSTKNFAQRHCKVQSNRQRRRCAGNNWCKNPLELGEFNFCSLQEEFGWKLVHGDVFRPPRKGMLLSVLLGSGVQVFCMTLVTLAFACLGFLSPANRGALMTCAMVLYVLLSTHAGYVSARVYKSFGGEKWKSNVLLTSLLCPG